MNKATERTLKAINLAATAAGLFLLMAPAVQAQVTPQSTLRNPLVDGAYSADPGMQATPLMPPPPGCSGSPDGVTPGMSGSPGYEPWVPNIPSNTAGITSSVVTLPLSPSDTIAPGQFNQSVYSSIPNPPSTPATADGTDPGPFPTKPSGYAAPAKIVDVNSDGYLDGDQAPQTKWQGQATKDYGRNYWNGQNSKLYDFGQKLQNMSNLAKTPQYSQDGPRPFQTASDYTTPVRQPQMSNSYGSAQQTTAPPYRQLFTNNVQAQQTQANY